MGGRLDVLRNKFYAMCFFTCGTVKTVPYEYQKARHKKF